MQLSGLEREAYRRYADLALPRHTSYPAVPFWREYGEEEFRAALERSNRTGRDLSIYVHVPFCERLCYYCTCTKEILPRREDGRWAQETSAYLERLEREFARVASALEVGQVSNLPVGDITRETVAAGRQVRNLPHRGRVVRQVHLGGGTPTYLTDRQLAELTAALRRQFDIATNAELSVELDPRVTSWPLLHTLRGLGFNRVSLGVQDFDGRVQAAVNRIQPSDLVAESVGACRKLGFSSINFDLIYGLPFQTPESVAQTIRKTIALGPDRVAFYRMAVIPELFRWQNVFRANDLPSSDATCEMFLTAIQLFDAAGYRFIGLDHFAKPTDELARAHDECTLRRAFQGMTTGTGLDVLGFGPSAISILTDAYAQNEKTLSDWSSAIDDGRLATCRSMDLTRDDRLRQAVIERLYCYAVIDKRQIEAKFGLDFDEHFSEELHRLNELERDGLVELDDSHIRLTHPLGRLLLRVVASVFDAYLPRDAFRLGAGSMLASKVG